MRSVVTFESEAFNTTEARDYFINPSCFGDDLGRWLMGRLNKHGVKARRLGQEDFGWYFEFHVPEGQYCFVISHRPEDDAGKVTWIGWVEREGGLLSWLFGGRHRKIAPSATRAVHAALSDAPEIGSLRWHTKKDFDRGREELGSAEP